MIEIPVGHYTTVGEQDSNMCGCVRILIDKYTIMLLASNEISTISKTNLKIAGIVIVTIVNMENCLTWELVLGAHLKGISIADLGK